MEKRADYDRHILERQCESLRRFAIFGVSTTMVAAIICILAVPFVFNYLQQVQSLLQNEADYCKVSKIRTLNSF